jgi:hypothetical protein
METIIEVFNESSYDLKIRFEQIPGYWRGFEQNIDAIMQGESFSFGKFAGRSGQPIKHVNPNERTVNIIISDLVTDEILKEMDNINKDIIFFEFIKLTSIYAFYHFKITDDLLQN